jgi:hypothetical protein
MFNRNNDSRRRIRRFAMIVAALSLVSLLPGCIIVDSPRHWHYWR